MSDALFDLLSGVASFLVLVAIFALVVWRSLRRDRRWPAIATRLGLDYARHDDTPLAAFGGFRIVAAGASHSLANVLSGRRVGVTVWLADYRYTTRSVGSVEPYGFTLCLLQDDDLELPHFFLSALKAPRVTNRAPLVVSSEDDLPEVELPDESPFAGSFRLATTAPEAAGKLLTAGLHVRLTALADPYVELECRGAHMAVATRTWIAPEDAGTRLEQALAVADELRRARPW